MRWPRHDSPFAAMIAHWRNPSLRAAFAHRLLHPVRLHRHLHLRQFRAGARAAVARARWTSASSISCSCPPSSRRCLPGRRSRGSARGRPSGARLRWPPSVCRCCCPRISPPCWPAWCWSASAPSSRRPSATGFVGQAARDNRGVAERDLSRLLFPRRPRRQRRARPALRPLGMDGLRRRRRCGAGDSGVADHPTRASITQRRTPSAGKDCRLITAICSRPSNHSS